MLFVRFLLVIIILTIVSASAKTDWKLRKEASGVTIYTRNVEGSLYDEFKGVVTITNTTLTLVLNVIIDVQNYPNNFPNCASAKVLEQKSKYDDIHYITIKAPWPITDRDAIYEATTTFSPDGKRVKVKLDPLGDYIREKKNYIRVHNGSGFWDLQEVAPNTVQVIYQFHADPAGEIPAWVANSVIVSNPLKTLENLKRLAKKT